MLKKASLAVAIGLLALAGVTQADPIRQDIQVKATVPTDKFYVEPQGGWPTAPVQISFDPESGTFSKHTMVLRVKSTEKDVNALLAYPAIATDTNSSKTLALDVSVGTTKLTLAKQKIHPKGAAEATYQLVISSSVAAPAVGNYQGTVSLVFDAA
jgi:hypothetical protein